MSYPKQIPYVTQATAAKALHISPTQITRELRYGSIPYAETLDGLRMVPFDWLKKAVEDGIFAHKSQSRLTCSLKARKAKTQSLLEKL